MKKSGIYWKMRLRDLREISAKLLRKRSFASLSGVHEHNQPMREIFDVVKVFAEMNLSEGFEN